MRRLRQLAAVLTLALSTLLSAGPAAAIMGGLPDGNDHPATAIILVEEWGYCSGTLVSPTVVVTAGHCTKDFFDEVGVSEVYVSFDAEPAAEWRDFVENGQTFRVPYRTDTSAWITATEWYTHPSYDFAEWPFTDEVGVVILPAPVAIEPAQLPELGTLDAIYSHPASLNQTEMRVVGYGVTAIERGGGFPRWSEDVLRKQAVTTGYQGGIYDLIFQTHANPADGKGGGCAGDSGGAVYLGSSNTLLGVHFGGWAAGRGQIICGVRADLAYRLDTESAQTFLAGFGVPLP